MDDLIRQGIAILQGMWQRRWIGLAAAWIVGVAGVVAVMRMPDVYEASARIYVDTQSVLKPLMQGLAVQPNVDQQVMILSRTLISRPNVEKLIRMADLDLSAKSKADQDAMVDGLVKALKIDSLGRDNLYTLSYRDPKPEKAKRVVQSLASIFIESNLGEKRKDSDSAKKFIDEQIKVYEKKLEEAEDRLKEFKIRNLSSNDSLEQGLLHAALRADDAAQSLAARAARSRELARRAEEASSRARSRSCCRTTRRRCRRRGSSVPVPEIDGRLDALKKNLDALSQRYTDQHPDVIVVKRQIKELEDQKVEVLAARKKAAAATTGAEGRRLHGNPVYQQLRVSLAETEATVAQLRTRVARIRGALRQAQGVGQARARRSRPSTRSSIATTASTRGTTKRSSAVASRPRSPATWKTCPARISGSSIRRAFRRSRSRRTACCCCWRRSSRRSAPGFFASFAASQIWPTFFDVRSLRETTQLARAGRRDDARGRRAETPRTSRPDRLHRRRARLPGLLWCRPARDFRSLSTRTV